MRQYFVGAIIYLFAAQAAQAELSFCNRGDVAQTVGIAYKAGEVWASEGWWTIEPAACKVLLGGDLANQKYYYTVKEPPGFAGENYFFCAKDESFELTGADGDCGALGANSRPYSEIDTGATAKSFIFDLYNPTILHAEDMAAAPEGMAALPDAAMTDHFTQGQQGEPFTITARLQSCETVEGYGACFVYADGWRWAFDMAANNNPAAMQAMASLPVNTMLEITGDVVAYNDITVDALVSKIAFAPPDDNSETLDLMQGSWVSVDDPQSTMVIYGSEQTDSYGTEVLSTSVISFADACPDGIGGEGPKLVLAQMGMPPEEALCYAVEEVTDTSLTLMYIARGNFHSFVRP